MHLNTSFKILGLSSEVDEAQAKRVYKAQVRRWHPDQFPEGSAAKAGAEEQLKQINIAYAQVRDHLAKHRPDPAVTATATPTHPSPDTDRRQAQPVGKSKKHSWVDHLFEALNAFAGKRHSEPPTTPAGESAATRRKTFEQVLDEMAGGNISPEQKHPSDNPDAASRRTAAVYQRHRRSGGTVDAVGGTQSPGPVRPVSRVRGIGRSR